MDFDFMGTSSRGCATMIKLLGGQTTRTLRKEGKNKGRRTAVGRKHTNEAFFYSTVTVAVLIWTGRGKVVLLCLVCVACGVLLHDALFVTVSIML